MFSLSTLTYILFVFIGIGLVNFVMRRVRTGNLAQLADTLAPDAATRGWTVAVEQRGHVRVIRWSGVTDGIRWSAESLAGTRGSGSNRTRTSVTRWQTRDFHGTTGAILLMGVPDGAELPKAQQLGEGFLADLAMKAVTFALDKGIDGYFGTEIGGVIDARTLQRVESVETHLDGYAVMAEQASDASRLIDQRVGDAVRATTAGDADAASRRPWFVIWKGGVAAARMEAASAASELEPLIRAGTAVAKAVRW